MDSTLAFRAQSGGRAWTRELMGTKERLVLGVLIVQGVFCSWSIGGYPLNCLYALFGMSALSFVTLLLPVDGRYECRLTIRRLLRFPLLWLGLLFLTYILIGGMNQAWEYEAGAGKWWIHKTPHNGWLPTSIKGPFDQINPFRVMLVVYSGLMTACALWVGVESRRAIRCLLWVLGVNGLIFGVVAMVQRWLGLKTMLGLYYYPRQSFYGSFGYQNHAAVYLYLMLAVVLALGIFYYIRMVRRMERSGPHILCGAIAVVILMAIGLSFSRGGLIFGCAIFAVGLLLSVGVMVRNQGFLRGSSWLFVTFLVIGSSTYFVYEQGEYALIQKRFSTITEEIESRDSRRRLLIEYTYKMFQDNPIYGWGAGSFRYGFPNYRVQEPKLDFVNPGVKADYLSAHTDVVQTLAEYGYVGCSILAVMFLYVVYCMFRYRRGVDRMVIMLYVGCIAVLIHSMFEFIFQSPALLITFLIILMSALKLQYLKFDMRRRRRV